MAGSHPHPHTVRVEWEPELAEAVVRLVVEQEERGGYRRRAEVYRARAEAVYALAPAAREAAFAALHASVVGELGLEERLRAVVALHPLVLARVAVLRLVRAPRRELEGADLAPRRGAVLRLRPERCADLAAWERFVDHEMTHLGDLLDPAFGHDPHALAELPPFRRRVVQERYRLVWAASVDGRLRHAGRAPLLPREEHRRRLAQAFGVSEEEAERRLAVLWAGERPRHGALLAMATRSPGPGHPGAPCPLCGFPTYAWAPGVDAEVAALIARETPGWNSAQGACERCLERYLLRSPSGG